MKGILPVLLSMLGWYLLFAGFTLMMFKWFFPLHTKKEMKLTTKGMKLQANGKTKLHTREKMKQREALYEATTVTDEHATN